MVGLVAQVLDHRQLFRIHLLRDLFQHLVAGNLVRQRGDDDVTVLLFETRALADTAVAGAVHLQDFIARRDDLRLGRKVRPVDVLAQLLQRGLRLLQQADAGAGDFPQIVRQNIGRHAHRDAGAAVQQHVRQPRRQRLGFFQRTVEIRRPRHRALPQFAQQHLGVRRQPRLGVAHRRERFRIVAGPPVALAVDQRVAVRERLRHQHHRLVTGAVAVRVVLAEHVTDGACGFLVL